MAITILAAALEGADAVPIEVEVDIIHRLPAVTIVGLAASAVKESAERVRSAIGSVGLDFPKGRIVVNLMPADVRKEGTALDLPVALGILAADGQVDPERLTPILAVGELSLSGGLRPVRGALSVAVLARRLGRTLVLPRSCARVATLVPGAKVIGADTLGEVVAWLNGEHTLEPVKGAPTVAPTSPVDMADVRGQEVARYAMEVSAAGAHHVLFVGPPGCGKTMLARRLPTILPPLRFEEALAVTRIHCAAGLGAPDVGLVAERPFRAPHHSISAAGLAGDRTLRPGELSLAHQGVLFLDEATEFSRSVLETLRQPLQDGHITLSRARGSVTHPAALTLVLACNPCPCGYRSSRGHACACGDDQVRRYFGRLSGPILDRIDLRVDLEPVPAEVILTTSPGERSATIRDRVVAARQRQRDRGQSVPNAQLDARSLQAHARLDDGGRAALAECCRKMNLSARGASRLLKVARTVADLDGTRDVSACHLHRASGFRPRIETV